MHATRPRILFPVCALLAIGTGASLSAQTQPRSSQVELVHIDGRKNPELIPQWSAWGYAFRVFAGGPKQLPTSLLPHVSAAEEALVMKEASAVQQIEAKCQERLGQLIARRGGLSVMALDQKVRALSLECRRETLAARDRILEALNPGARAALMAFVESTKAGTSLTIPKKQLDRFREPE